MSTPIQFVHMPSATNTLKSAAPGGFQQRVVHSAIGDAGLAAFLTVLSTPFSGGEVVIGFLEGLRLTLGESLRSFLSGARDDPVVDGSGRPAVGWVPWPGKDRIA